MNGEKTSIDIRIMSAYWGVVLLWSTTPITVKWSNEGFGFISAMLLRVLLATLLGIFVLRLMKQPFNWSMADLKIYLAGGIGIFPSMFLVYWATQHIPSGLVSVLLGLYPFAVGIFSQIILKQNLFDLEKTTALIMAVIGLGIINHDQLNLDYTAMFGVLAVFVASICWALSTVLLKKLEPAIHPFKIGVGTLLVSLPWLVLMKLTLTEKPTDIDIKAIASIVYLVLFGFLVGHTLFFFVLKKCSVGVVSLIPLITPVVAISIGSTFGGESLSSTTMFGALIIMFSLAVYQGIVKFSARKIESFRRRILARE